MKVLVAEDNEESRYLLVKLLRAYGHEVTATANGAEALQQALKEPPDILVTDILMPQMDGYQLCHEWRQHDKLKDIPFIFYTATYTSDEDEKFALSLGASTFIRKPAEPDAFIRILEEVFEKAKSGLLAPPKVAPLEPSLYLTEYNKRLVAKLNNKVADLEEAEGKLRHANSVLRAIRGINQLIVREKDRAKILQGACEILIEVREYKFAWIGLIEEGHKRVLPAAKAGVEEDYLNSLRITWDESESEKGPTGTAIKTRQPFIMNNIPGEPRYKPWREEALKWGYVSWAAIPLVHDEQVYGALNVYSSLEEGFDDEEVRLLAEVSSDIAFALKAIHTEEEHKRAEEEIKYQRQYFQSLLESSPEAVASVDTQNRIVDINTAFEKILGYTLEDIKGKDIDDFILPKNKEEEGRSFSRRTWEGEVVAAESIRERADGREIPVSILAAPIILNGKQIGSFYIYRDITGRKKAEEEIKRRAAQAMLGYEVGQRISSKLELDELLSEIVTAVRDAVDYYGVMVLLVDEEAQHLTMQSIAGGYAGIFPRDLYHAIGEGMTGYAAASGKTQVSGDVSKDPHYVREADEETKSELTVPIKRGQKVIGVLDIQSNEFDAFDEADVMLMETLADKIAVAIENARLYEAVQQELAERKRAEEQLEHSFIDLAETVSRAMESRDPYTSGHQRRVAELARLVGEKMGLGEDRLKGLHIGGLIHDIGKISIPESILAKPGRLTDEEWALVRIHAKQGYEVLKDTRLPWPVAEMARHHHERLDGSGYPDGISGDELSLENRILGVCDVVEAMSSFRPYRPAKSLIEVLGELRKGRGTKYDPDVVDVMLELIESGEFEIGGK